MISKISFVVLMICIYCWWIHPIFVKPFLNRRKSLKRINKRIEAIKKLGFFEDGVELVINNPTLSQHEIKLMSSQHIPTDEHILRYYKMYCLKHEKDNTNIWTTLKPMSFEDWEEKAKTESGGYKFIIPYTCDTMIGIPPYQTYHRYIDYEKLVKKEDDKFMNELMEEKNED